MRVESRPADSTPKIVNLGFPIEADQDAPVRARERPSLLVMGGGAGTGPLAPLVRALSQGLPDHRIIVVCGWNARLRRRLERWAKPNVEVHGFVQNVPELMAQSDVVITKAGPVTIMEAVAAGRPLIVTDWVGMQERDNVQFVVDQGLGLFCPRVKDLCDAVRDVYARYSEFLAAKPANVEHGPDRIAHYVLDVARNGRARPSVGAAADHMAR
jgi:UDP-N-acetylglucosamine:LPS N-acetylglucosamine transferase